MSISVPFLSTLSGLQRGIGVALIVALVCSLIWGFRVDGLRAMHKERIDAVVVQLKNSFDGEADDAGRVFKPTARNAATLVKRLSDDRNQFRAERDTARNVLNVQSGKIKALTEETQRLQQLSEENAKLARKVIAERDVWIKRAREASTRAERLAAEQELAQCQEVLDALFEAGF